MNTNEKLLQNLRLDAIKVIEQLCLTKCDDAWSIIKLNNMIQDIDDALAPTCMTCDGDTRSESHDQ